ncbi:tRNA 2-thiocytidine biosynthesis protein TtcA [Anaerotruncus massiliensis (ex Liu et al. 2021)]|uniref:tRNA 2-thiocytidine biosynthesis protein TtcA n=2 Tax=Anaerotruncus TaxID=244127 RepID=A0A498CS81_9FIRM|nr:MULTISPECIES: tRNA 2-thiocytidine biosynthesis TtcA family protein [Anaerotruncus]MBC3939843.1 tRNA 2-thiocytidine biosynthesis protein TtcA [Anaerotruncus massiliensis (ex Togo et al. 2019)]RLL07672.1 tRNA 2-thiocytidine biosynthesis protein TtcA [Anaerotruncus massiliensis (ex Liu et al. 2021)]
MQEIMGYIRRAVEEYRMIEDGDTVAVGVSGGKDSVALLAGLAGVRRFIGIDFTLKAVTLDNCFNGEEGDFSPIADLCGSLGVEYILRRTDIGQIIFGERSESNPCSLCARMRRGVLHDTAKANSCNKIALGHHFDDAVETFLMNLFNEGRIGCFSPVSYLSRKDLTMIRPLIFATEREVRNAVNRAGLPVVKSKCPVDGCTERQWTKEFLYDMEKTHPGITKRIFGAIRRGHVSGW